MEESVSGGAGEWWSWRVEELESGGVGEWRSGKGDGGFEDGGGEEARAVGTEFGAGEFDGERRAVRDEVERCPNDVVLFHTLSFLAPVK